MNEHVLKQPIEQARGAIGRYPGPNERYVFEFGSVAPRTIHMLGVRRPLLVRWFVRDKITAERVLRPWIGFGRYRADRVTEERPASNQ